MMFTLLFACAPGTLEAPASSNDTELEESLQENSVDTGDSSLEWSWPQDYRYLCDVEPPPWADQPPAAKAYSGGECPALVAGTNSLLSSGAERAFILVLPEEIGEDERLPMAVLWHPLATDADVFLEQGELQRAVDEQRFIAVLPEDKGDLYLQWPWSAWDSESRIEEELVFFDDMYACVTERLPVNLQCVANGGVSSGALWSDQLGWERSTYLSSLVSLSGGVGDGSVVRDWGGAEHKLPVINLWGGEDDQCYVFEFTPLAQRFGNALEDDGHAVVECVHNCGHAVPPSDSAEGSQFEAFWTFFLDHPYWLEDGQSPYLEGELPEAFPDWCAYGNGSATERTGVCEMENQCEGL